MKAFTRHRTPKPDVVTGDAPPSAIEPTNAPTETPIDAPIDPSDDFIERLGDLDRFIGGPAVPPVAWPATPVSRNLFSRPDEPEVETYDHVDAAPTDEADDFMERLGDLDRFIGGATPQAPAPTTDHDHEADDEADDFMQRLGDLDRFIGGGPSTPPTRQG